MSQFTFLASNAPLANVDNPHVKQLSVNEAAALGIEIPEMLPKNIDRDKPGVMLWVDDEENFGDISIYEAKWCKYETYAEGLAYNSIVEWTFTEERAERLIAYIRKHLETADLLELWHIWLDSDNEIEGIPEIVSLSAGDLTPGLLAKYLKDNHSNDRPFRMIFKRCVD
jgi:hypothetical protein